MRFSHNFVADGLLKSTVKNYDELNNSFGLWLNLFVPNLSFQFRSFRIGSVIKY